MIGEIGSNDVRFQLLSRVIELQSFLALPAVVLRSSGFASGCLKHHSHSLSPNDQGALKSLIKNLGFLLFRTNPLYPTLPQSPGMLSSASHPTISVISTPLLEKDATYLERLLRQAYNSQLEVLHYNQDKKRLSIWVWYVAGQCLF